MRAPHALGGTLPCLPNQLAGSEMHRGRSDTGQAAGGGMRSVPLALACLAVSATSAAAQIRIDEARIVAGDLRVSGRAKPNTSITFDERHETRTTPGGFFTFRLQYLPPD